MSIPCEASIVVNAPVEADAPPIAVPSIVPPLMSAVVTVPKFAHVPETVVAFASVQDAAVSYTHLTLPTKA